MLLLCAGLLACDGVIDDQANENCGGAGGTHEPTVPTLPSPDPPSTSAKGVHITGITLTQAVSRPIMEAGSTVTAGAPIIAGREALLRVHYTLDSGYSGKAVFADLHIAGVPVMRQTVSLSGSSSESVLSSTINFKLRADALKETIDYRIDITPVKVGGGTNHPDARFPQNTAEWASLQATRTSLNVVLVPIQYGADGSDRLPDTSTAQIQRLRDALALMYPVADLSMTVRNEPLAWSGAVSADGNGWGAVLSAVADLRTADGVSSDTYYYGLVNPNINFNFYCGPGCVAGLGFQTGPSDNWARAAVGVGFKGNYSGGVLAHEQGHNHGLDHAPCGVTGDPDYPHPNASIGTFGYNLQTQQLLDPNSYVDMMSYCDPAWISDFSFTRIQQRMTLVSGAAAAQAKMIETGVEAQPEQELMPMARMLIDAEGHASWLEDTNASASAGGIEAQLHFDDSATIDGRFYAFDHIDGGVLMVPAAQAHRDAAELTLSVQGQQRVIETL